MRNVAGKPYSRRCPAISSGASQKIRRADVADLAGSNEVIEGAEDLLDRREGVEPVELEEIDVVGAQSPKAGVNGADEMKPRRTDVVRIPAMTKTRLRGDEHAIAPAGDGSAEDLFRLPTAVRRRCRTC